MGEDKARKIAVNLNYIGTILFPLANILQYCDKKNIWPLTQGSIFYNLFNPKKDKGIIKLDLMHASGSIIALIGGMQHVSGIVFNNTRTTIHGTGIIVSMWLIYRYSKSEQEPKEGNRYSKSEEEPKRKFPLLFFGIMFIYLYLIENSDFLYPKDGKIKINNQNEKYYSLVEERKRSMLIAALCLFLLSNQETRY